MTNNLATQFPAIAAEWHPSLNGDLLPTAVTTGSKKKVWWICSKGHSYHCQIFCRTSRGHGCSYCAGQKVLAGFNDLATIHPELVVEWHHELNVDLLPSMVTSCSGKKVWWTCSKGHSYFSRIASRTKLNTGCPICKESKGEKTIKRWLDCKGIKYTPEQRFEECYEKNTLPFDFYLPEYRMCIEFQGRQHYQPVDYFGGQESFEGQLCRDKIKTDFCKANNIKLLTIPFTERPNIGNILGSGVVV